MTLTASEILESNDIEKEEIDLPEWGGKAFIRMMTGGERDSWEVYAQNEIGKKGKINMRAKLAGICLCDESGKRLFTDDQTAQLSEKSSAVLDRVYEAAIHVNRLSSNDVRELEKN